MDVLVVLPVNGEHKKLLEAQGRACSFRYIPAGDVTAQDVAAADIIIGNVPAKLINASPKLRFLQLNSAGADNYIVPGVLAKDTLLANATGAYSKTVSEHALALTFCLMKKLYLYRDNQRKSLWQDMGQVSSLEGATVVIVGLGDIGLTYARLVKAFGAYVIGMKRRPSAKPDCVDELCPTADLLEALKRADVVLSVLPQTPATVHLYTAECFEAMKPSALFINCGRGTAVDGAALQRALQEKQIAAAAIDVCEQEPLPADSPLWQVENLVITPHTAGGYHLPDTLDKIVDIAAYNLKAFTEGAPVKNLVDFETGYKK